MQDFKDFEKWLRSMGRTEVTINQYLYHIKTIPEELILKPKDLNKWLFSGKKPSVIYHLVSIIRSYYRFLQKEEWIKELDLPKWKSGEKKLYMNKEQVQRFLKNCNKFEYRICKLMLETGIRRLTLLNLEKSNFDFEKKILIVPSTIPGNKGRLYGELPISDGICTIISKYSKNREGKLFILTFGDDKKPYKVQTEALTCMIRNIGKKSNMGWVTPHILRHSLGQLSYDEQKDILLTRDILLQKSVVSTERYAHRTQELRKLNEKLWSDDK